MPKGHSILPRQIGVNELARETGYTPTTVGKKMRAGMTVDEIREAAVKWKEEVGERERLAASWRTRPMAITTPQARVTKEARGPSTYINPPRPVRKGGMASMVEVDREVEELEEDLEFDSDSPSALLLPGGELNLRDRTADEYGMKEAMEDNAFAESVHSARLRRAIAMADAQEIANAKLRGDLTPNLHIRTWGTRILTKARDMMLQIPSELQDTLAVESRPGECYKIVMEEMVRVLETLHGLESLWVLPGDDVESKVA